MQISFHGAARNVTGSKHLITLSDNTKILLDCGMFQGLGKKTAELNDALGFEASSITALLLSHAHIDHSGLIPKLVKEGFNGPIFCTPATAQLAEILLKDSAIIQEHEAQHHNRKRKGHHLPAEEPLYTMEDVEKAVALFKPVPYREIFMPAENVTASFHNAGHIIGSACIHVTVKEGGESTSILFSGDVGRYRSTLLQSPAAFPQPDYIILESTYGGSLHDPLFNSVDPLLKQIKRTCLEKGGKLIIPAFSVGRTQEVLFALNQLELEHRLPALNYFVDSPLGKKATDIIKLHMEEFNDKLQEILKKDDDPFDFAGLKYIENAEESKALSESDEPCVIIASSGTADAGRVKHHLCNSIHNRNNTVLFVGHCQQDSTGGKLLSGVETISIFGDDLPVAAEVDALTSMSAHGDSADLIQFISCVDPALVQKIFLVHGEHSVQETFANKLKLKGFENVVIPEHGETIELVKPAMREAV